MTGLMLVVIAPFLDVSHNDLSVSLLQPKTEIFYKNAQGNLILCHSHDGGTAYEILAVDMAKSKRPPFALLYLL